MIGTSGLAVFVPSLAAMVETAAGSRVRSPAARAARWPAPSRGIARAGDPMAAATCRSMFTNFGSNCCHE
jgi:hypothetical protein